MATQLPFLSTSGPFVFEDARTVLFAGALVCGVGMIDDIFDLDALTKLGGQVIAVGLLVYSGIQFRWFYQPDGTSSPSTRPRERCSPRCWWWPRSTR